MSDLHDGPPFDETFEELAAGYFDEVLNDAELEQFKQLLREDDRRVRRFAELAQLHQIIESEITYHKQAQKFNLNPEPNDSGVANALAELASLYEDNLKPSLSFAAWREEQASRALAKRRRVFLFRFIIGGACAAVIALATVFAVMLVGGDVPDTTIADQPRESVQPPERAPAAPRIVATLTATHNAQWAEQPAEGASAPGGSTSADPAPGDALHPGSRLTLTAGFAEITTARGAVVILEAPATVEFTDSDNALSLHTGKLVGICETDSSKGFVVRTPHLDITDLGTRFGVDLSLPYETQVHVLEGEVALTREPAQGRSLLSEQLGAGRAVTYGPVQGLAQIDFEPEAFIGDMRTAALRPDFAGSSAIWLGQVAGDLGQDMRKSDSLQVFLERSGFTLPRAVAVDFNRESEWAPHLGIGKHRVAAGERVDVYLLHFDLVSGHQQPEHFTLDFGRPILGVIGTQTVLDQTDTLLGMSGVIYPVFNEDPLQIGGGHRGLNYRHITLDADQAALELKNDLVSISPSGTELRLRLWGGEPGVVTRMDQVRVLVRSLDADNKP
jgi:hypothetical protein